MPNPLDLENGFEKSMFLNVPVNQSKNYISNLCFKVAHLSSFGRNGMAFIKPAKEIRKQHLFGLDGF